jgi:hypothetical protein
MTGLLGIFLAVVYLTRTQVSEFYTLDGQNHKISLRWKTAHEINLEGFYVQRSNDGITFSRLSGYIKPMGNNFIGHGYGYTDDDIVLAGEPYYYRLEIILRAQDAIFVYATPISISTHTPTSTATQIRPTIPAGLSFTAVVTNITNFLGTPTISTNQSGSSIFAPPGAVPQWGSTTSVSIPGGPELFPPGYSPPLPTTGNTPPGELPPGYSPPPTYPGEFQPLPPGVLAATQRPGTNVAPPIGNSTELPPGLLQTTGLGIQTTGTRMGSPTLAFAPSGQPLQLINYDYLLSQTAVITMTRVYPDRFYQSDYVLVAGAVVLLLIGLSVWYLSLRRLQ